MYFKYHIFIFINDVEVIYVELVKDLYRTYCTFLDCYSYLPCLVHFLIISKFCIFLSPVNLS